MAFDSNGNPKKIARIRVANPYVTSGSISSAQWVRVATFTNNGAAMLSLNSSWNNNPGLHLIVDMILHSHSLSYNKVAVLSRLSNTSSTVLSKLRLVVKRDSTCYIDVCYDADKSNSFSVTLMVGHNVSMLEAPVLDAEIPEGYSTREFDLSTVSDSAGIVGGVKCYLSTYYAILQKGGLRNEYDNTAYQQFALGYDARSGGRQKSVCRRYGRQADDARSASYKPADVEYAGRRVPIRPLGSVGMLLERLDIHPSDICPRPRRHNLPSVLGRCLAVLAEDTDRETLRLRKEVVAA